MHSGSSSIIQAVGEGVDSLFDMWPELLPQNDDAPEPGSGVAASSLPTPPKPPTRPTPRKPPSGRGPKNTERKCEICPATITHTYKSPFCEVHKRTYDALMRQATKQDKESKCAKGDGQVAYIKRIRKGCEFIELMNAFERDCPPGAGVFRPTFAFAKFNKTYSAETGAGNEWYAKPLTWKAYRKWAVDEAGGDMTEQEAAKEWERVRNQSARPRDSKGPKGPCDCILKLRKGLEVSNR